MYCFFIAVIVMVILGIIFKHPTEEEESTDKSGKNNDSDLCPPKSVIDACLLDVDLGGETPPFGGDDWLTKSKAYEAQQRHKQSKNKGE